MLFLSLTLLESEVQPELRLVHDSSWKQLGGTTRTRFHFYWRKTKANPASFLRHLRLRKKRWRRGVKLNTKNWVRSSRLCARCSKQDYFRMGSGSRYEAVATFSWKLSFLADITENERGNNVSFARKLCRKKCCGGSVTLSLEGNLRETYEKNKNNSEACGDIKVWQKQGLCLPRSLILPRLSGVCLASASTAGELYVFHISCRRCAWTLISMFVYRATNLFLVTVRAWNMENAAMGSTGTGILFETGREV